jgi:EpsI family protein
MNNRNFIIVTVILLVVSIIGFKSYLPAKFDTASTIRVADFPMQVGEWTATDIPLTQKEYDILETKNLFVRDYKNSKGEVVNLYVIYSEQNRKVSHPPEVCYTGSGATITERSQFQITDSIRANKLLVEKADSRQLVVYWYKAGKFNTAEYLKQQLKVSTDLTFGRKTSGALIRLSAEIKGDDESSALTLIKSFCSEIETLIERYVP